MTPNGPVSRGDLFVFYGMLKAHAAGHPEDLGLAGAGRYLGPCRIRGALYDLGAYPGLLPGEQLCHGELYQVDKPEIAEALDAFEDLVPDDPNGSLYLRCPVPVLDTSGAATGQTAWAYLYNRSAAGHTPIVDGCWRGPRTPAQGD
jgi:gamma-glutamylcyclotransferase (GGCT)/AIG2-like uncharacterized protein YtfP